MLGFVYLPLIRRSLSKFIRIWNHHKLRTEGFKTPVQLYAILTQLQSGAITNSMLSNDDLHAYGVDWDGPIPEDMSIDEDGINTTAIVEPSERPLGEDHWRVLTEDYRRTLEEVFQHGNED